MFQNMLGPLGRNFDTSAIKGPQTKTGKTEEKLRSIFLIFWSYFLDLEDIMSIFRENVRNAMQYRLKILFKVFLPYNQLLRLEVCRNLMCRIRTIGQVRVKSVDSLKRAPPLIVEHVFTDHVAMYHHNECTDHRLSRSPVYFFNQTLSHYYPRQIQEPEKCSPEYFQLVFSITARLPKEQ